MSKLSINSFDTRDLITQAKTLNEGMRKEAQLARIALTQGFMPTINAGNTGAFVMLTNTKQAVYLKSKTMNENAFVAGLVQLGKNAGLNQEDVHETYNDNNAVAMALCNFIQNQSLKSLSERTPEEFEAISKNLEERVEKFVGDARFANIPEGEIMAVVQQIKKDLEATKKIVAEKSEENTNAR